MKKLIFLSLLITGLVFNACVKDSDYETPQIADSTCVEPISETDQVKTISYIITTWEAAGGLVEFNENDGTTIIYLEGYVVSDDQTGNFYKEIFIQDKLENPTAACKVAIDFNGLFGKFPVGKKIYVELNDLAVNKSNGELVIGEKNGTDIDAIRPKKAFEIIHTSCEETTVVPFEIDDLGTISNSMLGTYVQLNNMQFIADDVGEPFVDPYDQYDSYRTLVSCYNSAEFILETSTYAAFAEVETPSGMGSIKGILSRNYYDDSYVLRISDPSDITFDGNRCDPIFQDGFNNGFDKWYTVSVEGGQTWDIDTQYGNPGNCARMSGYDGGAQTNEDWLISKAIDLSGLDNASLNFQTARNYSGPVMEVFLSSDYDHDTDEDPYSATWTPVTATLSEGSWDWTGSGEIDLTDYVGGNVFVAFKYVSTSSQAATYEVDNVVVDTE